MIGIICRTNQSYQSFGEQASSFIRLECATHPIMVVKLLCSVERRLKSSISNQIKIGEKGSKVYIHINLYSCINMHKEH